MGMSFSEAKDAAKRGYKIRRNAWGQSDPAYIIYIEAKMHAAKGLSLANHIDRESQVYIAPHFGAVFETETHSVLLTLGYNFHHTDLTVDDWHIV